MNNNETIADIVKEMRECDGHRAYYDGGLHHESGEESVVDVYYLHDFADRIEKAEKPIGNAAAMLEALDEALRFIGNLEIEPYSHLDEVASELRDKILDARAMPKRNCDVGTADEQAQRYDKFCEGMDCVKCPVHALWHHYFEICKNRKVSCGLIWAQMPYEADAKKEKSNDAE